MKVSIIIPSHNEGSKIIDTLNSIKDTAPPHLYEIIVVDDASDRNPSDYSLFKPSTDFILLEHSKRKGVGAAFDTGVQSASGDYLFLMGADIRFRDNGWLEKMTKEVYNNPKSLICTTNLGLNHKVTDINNPNLNKRFGATILLFHDKHSHPRKPAYFRGILDAKWQKKKRDGTYPLQCILGAAYGVTKSWYEYIDGFWGHKYWGNLEPYISLKSWFMGGDCLIASDIETGHIYNTQHHCNHTTPMYYWNYNKLLICHLLFKDHDRDRLVKFLGTDPNVLQAQQMIKDDMEAIEEKRKKYKAKIVRDQMMVFESFDIDTRLDYF